MKTIADFENMSDEQLAGLSDTAFEAPAEEAPAAQEEQQQEEPLTPDPVETEGSKPEGEADADGAEGEVKEGESPKDEDLSDADLDKQTPPTPDKPVEGDKPAEDEGKKPEPKPDASAEKKDPPTEGDKPAVEGAKPDAEAPAVDYEAEYKKLIGVPIKANGKEITLKDTAEVMRLVQQGAGYSKKMEELKPARRTAAILESAGLLGDEQALGHMIDLYNGDPKALAKLVKDLKIDIFELDLEGGAEYTPNRHLQTDEAVNFTETLKEVRTLDGGKEALALIDSWDQKSKDMVWGNAAVVRQIFEYKQSGVYDAVASEVERRRTLGQIPAGTPFIQAFQQVGDEMAKAASTDEPTTPAVEEKAPPTPEPAKPEQRKPVHSGPAPRKEAAPDARAAAAAAPRTGAGVAKQQIDIYALSDKDIENMSSPPA